MNLKNHNLAPRGRSLGAENLLPASAHRFGPPSILLLALLLCLASAPATSAQRENDRILTFVKGTPAKDFDSKLPKMRFERWLLDVVGKGVELHWELNDCGEQSGDPEADKDRDMPICAGVDAQLDRGRSFQILLAIGTQKKGVGGKPEVYSIFVEAHRRIWEVKQLRDLPKALESPPPK